MHAGRVFLYASAWTLASCTGSIQDQLSGGICGTARPGAAGMVPYERVQQIFNANCALSACHGSPNPPAGLNLKAGASFGNLVGVKASELPGEPRVDPGRPGNSYL